MNSEDIIALTDVRKTFRDFWLRPTVAAVDGLSLTVRRGEVFGLLGPNGSGKSTTIKMILGLLDPSAGAVRMFGLPPRSTEARRRLGYLPELSYLHPFLTARETLLYYAGLCGLNRRVAASRADELLVLDEPTSGLDPISTKEVKTLVKALSAGGMTILMTSHLLADAEDVCDRVMILDRGRSVAEGRVDELGTSLEEFFLAKVGDVGSFKLAGFLKG